VVTIRSSPSRYTSRILGFGKLRVPAVARGELALLTYRSCWLKCHEPAIYVAALLNSQPMGFYNRRSW